VSVQAKDIKSGADVLIDCISAPKNFLNAATKGSAAALPFLSAAQGLVSFGAGAYTSATSLQDLYTATKTNDRPGITRGVVGTFVGGSQMTVGSAAMACGIGAITNNAVALGAGVVINPALIAMYGFFIARSSLSLHYVRQFEHQLTAAQEKGHGKQFLLREWAHNATHLKKIVGDECFAEIQKLASGQPVDLDLLIQKITKTLLKQKITNGYVIGMSILGIIATVLGIALATSCPQLSPFLFGVAGILWLLVDCPPLHRKFQELIINKNELIPIIN
jgi:hypothetical protein